METGIKHLHSFIAYIALALLLITSVVAIIGLLNKKIFTSGNRKLGLFALIATHTQFLIGLILYFLSPLGMSLFKSGSVMGNSFARLTAVEHPVINLIAVVLITIGWSKHKKQTEDAAKFKSFAVFYTLGLILILTRIPWSNWL